MHTQDPLFKTPERIDENREWQTAQDIQKVGYEWFLLLSVLFTLNGLSYIFIPFVIRKKVV